MLRAPRALVVVVVTGLLALTAVEASATSWELDNSFSGDGRLRLTALDGFAVEDIGIVGDKIYASGLTTGNPAASGFVARTLADGTLDDSYGVDGVSSWTLDPKKDFGVRGSYDFEVLADGSSVSSYQSNQRLTVLRWTEDGALDRSFSGDGIRTFAIVQPRSSINSDPSGDTSVAIDHHGRVVVGAMSEPDTGVRGANVQIYRVLATGELDVGFSSDGVRRINMYTWDWVNDLTVDSRDRVLIASSDALSHRDRASAHVIRLTKSGAFDRRFSRDGVARFGFYRRAVDNSFPLEMDVARNDGVTVAIAAPGEAFGAARILPDGTLDPGYGVHGVFGLTCDCRVWDAQVSHGEVALAGSLGFDEQIVATISRSGSHVTQGPVDLFTSQEASIASVALAGDAVFVGGGVGLTAFLAKVH